MLVALKPGNRTRIARAYRSVSSTKPVTYLLVIGELFGLPAYILELNSPDDLESEMRVFADLRHWSVDHTTARPFTSGVRRELGRAGPDPAMPGRKKRQT